MSDTDPNGNRTCCERQIKFLVNSSLFLQKQEMIKKQENNGPRQQLKDDINILKTFMPLTDKEDQFDAAKPQQSWPPSGNAIMSLVIDHPSEEKELVKFSPKTNILNGAGLNLGNDEFMKLYGQADPELLIRKNRIDTRFKDIFPEENFVDEADQIEHITETTRPKKMQVYGHDSIDISSNIGYTDPQLLIRKNRIDRRFNSYIPETSFNDKANQENIYDEIRPRKTLRKKDNTYIPSKFGYDYIDEPIGSLRPNPFSVVYQYQRKNKIRKRNIYSKRSYVKRAGTHHLTGENRIGVQYDVDSILRKLF